MRAPRLDLREHQHPKCGGKDCEERDAVDAAGLCTHTVSAIDGLPIRCVGEWAYDKIYRLVQYFGTFAGGMGKKKKPGDASTPAGSPDGPPGKKQRRKARKSSKKRS